MSDSTNSNSVEVEELVDAYIRHLEGNGDRPDLTGIRPDTAAEASELFRLLDATWASDLDLPPIEEDPVALALGLVPLPDMEATTWVLGPKLSAVRRRRHLRPSDVARQLTEAGYPHNARSVVKLEETPANEVTRTFLSALIQALGCNEAELTRGTDADLDRFVAWLRSDQFDREVAKWAAETNYVGPDLRSAARARLLSARHRRGGESTPNEWITLVRTVLDSLR
jgi:hypothetical protein